MDFPKPVGATCVQCPPQGKKDFMDPLSPRGPTLGAGMYPRIPCRLTLEPLEMLRWEKIVCKSYRLLTGN